MMDEFMVFEEEAGFEPSDRNYAPLPLEYYKEMRHLSSAEFGELIRVILYFNLTGKVPRVEGTLLHYMDRVIEAQKRFAKHWNHIRDVRKEAGKKGAEARWSQENSKTEQSMANAIKNGQSKSESKSKSESESESNDLSYRMSVGYMGDTAPPTASGRERGVGPEAPVAEAMTGLLGIRPSQTCLGELRQYVIRLGADTCMYAVERAAEECQCTWKYVRGILRDMDRKGIRSRSQAEDSHRNYTPPTAAGKKTSDQSQYYTHESRPLTELERIAIAEALAEEL